MATHGHGDGYTTITVYLSAEDKDMVRRAAEADNRSVSNWFQHHAVPLAKRQVKKATGVAGTE